MVESFNMPIGKILEIHTETFHPGYRTIEQFEAVRAIVKQNDFESSVGDQYFDPGNSGSTYQGPFVFAWYDKSGHLHGTRIGKRGRILQEAVA